MLSTVPYIHLAVYVDPTQINDILNLISVR